MERGATSGLPVDGVGGERRHAHGDVLGAVGPGRGVAHALAGAHEHRLPRLHGHRAVVVVHLDGAAQHDRPLVEAWALERLAPALRRAHARDAQALLGRVDAAGVLVDELRRLPGRLHTRRLGDQLGHRAKPYPAPRRVSTGTSGRARRRTAWPDSPTPRETNRWRPCSTTWPA